MKKNILLASTWILLISSYGLAQAQLANPVVGNGTESSQREKINRDLILFSHKNRVNIIADATQFSAPIGQYADRDVDWIVSKLLDLAYVNNLTIQGLDDKKTFLIWSRPDAIRIAKELIATAPQIEVGETDVSESPQSQLYKQMYGGIENDRIGLRLADYLEQVQGWDGTSADISIELKVTDLPTEVSAPLISTIQRNISKARVVKQRFWLADAPWLADSFWQEARVGYFTSPENKVVFAVAGQSDGMDYFTTVELVKAPHQVEWKPTSKSAIGEFTQDVNKEPFKSIVADEGLASPVSLEIKDAALADVLAELQGESQVKLSLKSDALTNKRLTIAIKEMSVSEVMSALTQLYGIAWQKTAQGYSAFAGLSSPQIDALQVGEVQYFDHWREPTIWEYVPQQLAVPRPVSMKDELDRAGIDAEQLSQKQGVAFTSLPENLRALIRQSVEERMALSLINRYREAFKETLDLNGEAENSLLIQVKAPPRRSSLSIGARKVFMSASVNAIVLLHGQEVGSFQVHARQDRKPILAKIRQFEKEMEQTDEMFSTTKDAPLR